MMITTQQFTCAVCGETARAYRKQYGKGWSVGTRHDNGDRSHAAVADGRLF